MLQSVFIKFILMPLIIAILASAAIVLKWKNELVSNKKLIIFILLYSLVMAAPGLLGFANAPFVPWPYLVSSLLYLLFGVAFVQLYSRYFETEVRHYRVGFQLVVMLAVMALSFYLFALVFNWLSYNDDGYMAAASITVFPLPLVFYWTYVAFISIPYEIYEVWRYNPGTEELSFEGRDFNTLMVLELEFSRQPDDKDRLRVKAKAPADICFGDWFGKFISDYNDKFPNQPIVSTDEVGDPYSWVFYCKRSFFHRRRLLDPGLTIQENPIKEHVTIISKRVIEHKEELFYTNRPLILQA